MAENYGIEIQTVDRWGVLIGPEPGEIWPLVLAEEIRLGWEAHGWIKVRGMQRVIARTRIVEWAGHPPSNSETWNG